MAELTPGVPQVDDPELLAAIVRALAIKGPLGRLNVSDLVVPAIIVADVSDPSWAPTQIHSNGIQVAPVAGVILVDTGPLAAGIHDLKIILTSNDIATVNSVTVVHRNFDDTGTVEIIDLAIGQNGSPLILDYATSFVAGERIRIILLLAGAALSRYSAIVMAARRV